jgi:hypothetical protein
MWSVEYLTAAAEERVSLPTDIRARLARMTDVIPQNGVAYLPRDWVKHLGDKLWELRLTGRDGIARAIYVTATGPARRDRPNLHQEDTEDAGS